jgi:pimeloyl-ACP methyl ester carboxylesterase
MCDPSEQSLVCAKRAPGYINTDVFREVFAADLPQRTTDVMAAIQRPAELATPPDPVRTAPAWATIPSWFIVAAQDQTIPPEAQRFMAERADTVKTVQVRASHVVMISRPAAVARLIVDAVTSHT